MAKGKSDPASTTVDAAKIAQGVADLESERKKDWAKYSDEIRPFQNAVKDFEGSLDEVKGSVGSLGGEVGSLIANTKLKTSATAGQYPTASIVRRASRNVVEFPVFVSSSVPVDYATATNALLEQLYASFLQMAISQNPVISEADAKSGDIFRSMGVKSDVSKYLEYVSDDMFYAHDACHNVITTDEAVVEFNMLTVDARIAKLINEAVDHQPLSEFDHFFQEAKKKEPTEKEVLEQRLKDLAKRETELSNVENKNLLSPDQIDMLEHVRKDMSQIRKDLNSIRKEEREQEKHEKDEEDRETKRKRSADEDIRERFQAADEAGRKNDLGEGYWYPDSNGKPQKMPETRRDRDEKRAEEKLKYEKITATHAKAPQFMDETKIGKLNSMKPLMMTVGLRIMSEGKVSDVIDYVVGVKTHCRVIDAEVLPDFAEYPSKTMNFVSRKARWRAGELKFLDYLFARKEKKQAAYDSRDPKRKWYHRLYTLAHSKGSAKAAKRLTGSSSTAGLIPNVTMILSKSDVDMIEATNGIDLLNGSTAKRICNELFLIAMVVIDTDSQSVKLLLPDTMNDYEVHSMASINKQLATLDSSSDVSREVSKMMRGR